MCVYRDAAFKVWCFNLKLVVFSFEVFILKVILKVLREKDYVLLLRAINYVFLMRRFEDFSCAFSAHVVTSYTLMLKVAFDYSGCGSGKCLFKLFVLLLPFPPRYVPIKPLPRVFIATIFQKFYVVNQIKWGR